MLKQTISFTDYDGRPREITEYFHLNEAEIVDMQARSVNGIQEDMQDAILSNDAAKVLDFIKFLVHKSYGKKSQDGVNFDKSDELLNKFITSAYYSDFLLGLIEDDGKKGQIFVQGIMPAKLVERAMKQVQGENGGEVDRTVYEPDARELFAKAQAAKEEPTPLLYPQFAPASQPAEPTPPKQDEWNAFQQWQAQQEAASRTSSSAPASPDAFRVREAEPDQA